MGITITTRVPVKIERQLKQMTKIEHLDRSTLIRRLLIEAIKDWQINRVLEEYQGKKITIWKAARIADVPLREMIALAAKREIPFQYTIEDLREDFAAVR